MKRLRLLGYVLCLLSSTITACGTSMAPPGLDAPSSGTGGSVAGAGGSAGIGGVDFTTTGEGGHVCDGGVADAPPEPSACDASATVAFETTVFPILVGCTGELCHGPWTYDSIVGKVASECCDGRLLVAPSDPAHSYLLDKIRDHAICSGAPMPLGGQALSQTQWQAISDWICVGAPKN